MGSHDEKTFLYGKVYLQTPDKIRGYPYNKGYYYKSYKYLKMPNHLVLVIVKYLNGEGFVITAYLERK